MIERIKNNGFIKNIVEHSIWTNYPIIFIKICYNKVEII